jgi:hypothetical protein
MRLEVSALSTHCGRDRRNVTTLNQDIRGGRGVSPASHAFPCGQIVRTNEVYRPKN